MYEIPNGVNFNAILAPLVGILVVVLACGFIAGMISKLLPRVFQKPLIMIGMFVGIWGFLKLYPM